jgi:tetratricopeptide (TPR) repeat protein
MGKIDIPLWRNHIVALFLLIILAPFVLLASELIYYRRKKLSSDPKLRRKLQAQANKGAMLKNLKKASPEELDGVVQKEVVPYLNDLMGLPPGTTASELADKVDSPELADCLSHTGVASYMPGVGSVDKTELKNKMYKALRKFAVLVFIFILPFSGFATMKKDGNVKRSDEALIAYDNGDFAKAAKYYETKLNAHSPDPALLYNLGNCYCQLGKFSKALVCYERARRLAPRDSDITENMNYVRRKLFLPEEGAASDPYELLLDFRDSFRPDQWLLIAAWLWFVAGVILAMRRIPARKRRWIIPLGFVVFCLVASLIAAGSQYCTTYSDKEAVVIARNVPVYSLPSEKSTKAEFRLKDGERVKIEEQRLDWVRVRADNAEGWIHGKDVARLWGGDWSGFLNGKGK